MCACVSSVRVVRACRPCVRIPPQSNIHTKKIGLWEEQVAKFRGKVPNPEAVIAGRVVRIDEAEEPSDVLWENIDTSIIHRFDSVVRVEFFPSECCFWLNELKLILQASTIFPRGLM